MADFVDCLARQAGEAGTWWDGSGCRADAVKASSLLRGLTAAPGANWELEIRKALKAANASSHAVRRDDQVGASTHGSIRAVAARMRSLRGARQVAF